MAWLLGAIVVWVVLTRFRVWDRLPSGEYMPAWVALLTCMMFWPVMLAGAAFFGAAWLLEQVSKRLRSGGGC